MRSVLLIRPLCEGEEPEFAEPLGIERLAGYLFAHEADDVCLFDRRLYLAERQQERGPGATCGFYEDLEAHYSDRQGPDIIGLTLMTSADVADARRIIARLRAWWPSADVVAGGVYITTAYEEAARALPSHVKLIRGEGEAALLALAQDEPANHAETPPRPFEPAGCTKTPPPPLSPNEWALPFRPHLERYANLRCAVNVQSSRGCPGSCTFCATPMLSKELRTWQPRNTELVVDEVCHEANRLLQAGLPPIFNFVDDDFGTLERLEELARELLDHAPRIAFACEMRLASLAGASLLRLPERLASLHEAGLTRLFFGVESLNKKTLATWHKPAHAIDSLPQVLASCREAGIAVQAGYILWHPGQTVQSACDEVEGLNNLGIYSHRAALSRLIVFSGCALAKDAQHDGSSYAMDPVSEEFYRRFSAEAKSLTQAWTRCAIREPYEAARAYLTGETSPLNDLGNELDTTNEISFNLFMEMAHEVRCSG